ncbi:MAG: hypothetical protein BVN32_02215 [Proteobacteria bacterium ST_bin14]|nr:MAG: hypothetical protein BVN32_02215 [Proteobacteria bacterium ST_bin14]
MADEDYFSEALDQTGLVATGIFRVTDREEGKASPEFPIVYGYQFGAILFRGARLKDAKEPTVVLENGQSRAPLLERVAIFNQHGIPDGYVAAIFENDIGNHFGITAGHVVEGYRPGQRVPIECSECGDGARLVARAPGFIDAATVEFPCGGPSWTWHRDESNVRSAIEGETVHVHLGNTGLKASTVMMSLSSPSEIRSAATPKQFLIDENGHPGDSGSLVSASDYDHQRADLIGIYLGDANCQEPNGAFVTYGYGLDLKQAAALLGARSLKGDFLE